MIIPVQGALTRLLSGLGPRLGINGPDVSVEPGLGDALVLAGLEKSFFKSP